jgi:peptidylprolyl isomerase
MPRGRFLVLLAALLLVLTACGSAGSDASPTAGASGVTVSTDTSAKPEIEVPEGDAPTELVVETVVEGDGPEVASGDLVVVDYVGVLWDDGTEFDASWEGEAPSTFPVGTGGVIEGWDQGLVGQTVDSRVLLVVPPDLAYGEEGSGNIPADATLVFAVDIRDAFGAADAEGGTPVEDLPAGLPAVTGDPGEKPSISLDGTSAPTQEQAFVLVEGSGDPLAEGETLVVHAVGVSYPDGTEVLSTWETAPEAVPPDALPGLAEALDGANAGTRVLLTLPANPEGGQAVALVLDVLGTVPASR